MHRTCRMRSEEMGSFLFHGNCLEEKPDADTQVSSVFGIGCEDVNFVFPDPRGRSGELIIFCRPTARPGYQGGRGREPGKAGRAQPGQAKPGQTEPGQTPGDRAELGQTEPGQTEPVEAGSIAGGARCGDTRLGAKKRHLVRSRWLARGLIASKGVSSPFSENP